MAIRIKRSVALTLLSAAVVATGIQAPAQAKPVTTLDSVCYAGDVCMFEDEDYYGDKYKFGGNAGNFEINGWNGDNEISSVKNRSSYYLCLYEDDGQGGDWIRLHPGQYVTSLDDSYDFDNDAESFRLTDESC